MNLLGNLDCEARWAGVALPAAVQRRISLYATLFAACSPDDAAPHHIWVPAPIDPGRLVAHPGWTPPVVHVTDPVAPELTFGARWADPAARAANDRSATLAIAHELGVALPGAALVGSLAELDAHVARLAGPSDRPWICKARWTAAGRDRARGAGGVVTGELRRRLARMFDRLGPLVLEPWLDRIADLALCGEIDDAGAIRLAEPHRLISDPRGGFVGIELSPIDRTLAEALASTAHAAAALLAARTGYRGPFTTDAFVYRDAGAHHLHPLCELNARHTFGWIARGLARRLGARRLGFDAPPPGATVLIAPGDDGVTAWCA